MQTKAPKVEPTRRVIQIILTVIGLILFLLGVFGLPPTEFIVRWQSELLNGRYYPLATGLIAGMPFILLSNKVAYGTWRYPW
ncbi:MAG: hypothetical protein IPK50_06175 [Fibrobacterota bacterium]|nr:MAG: hypothetical protein IPK50_06175 [Fibrobacterota bacterium]